MDHFSLLTVTLAFCAFALVGQRVTRSVLTAPMLFSAFGFAVGPSLLGWVRIDLSNAALHTLAEITLVLVLFSDAARIDLRQLRRDHDLPVRMLLVGVPLSLVLGAGAALLLFPNFGIWEAALLAAILVPTDAALGQAVVENPAVPARVRMALGIESGLNDGIVLPLVLLFAALASVSGETGDHAFWALFAGKQIVLGPLAGIAVGIAGARLLERFLAAGWMKEGAEGVFALALAFTAFALAEAIGGNGFISAFVGGLAFGNTLGRRCRFLYEFEETEARILVMLTFAAFGAVMVPVAQAHLSLACVVYSLFALTVMRMAPVALSLLGTGIKPVTGVFLGWFGPRGLASVLFVLLVVKEYELVHETELLAAVVLTVVLSIVLHGVSATPAARAYGRQVARAGECEEIRAVSETPFAEPGPG